jgi:hypothetical protein
VLNKELLSTKICEDKTAASFYNTRNFAVAGNAVATELTDLYGSMVAFKPKGSKKREIVRTYGKNCL